MRIIRKFVAAPLGGGLALAMLCGLTCGLALQKPLAAFTKNRQQTVVLIAPAAEFPQ
jgi:hypothetical protein